MAETPWYWRRQIIYHIWVSRVYATKIMLLSRQLSGVYILAVDGLAN